MFRSFSCGKSVDDIIEIENQRAGKTLDRRNRFLSYLVKKRHNFQCQICSAGETARIPSFIQVHHMVRLADDGEDHSRNMIVTCNYHHEEIHRGRMRLENGEKIQIEYDGKKMFTTPN